MKLIPWQQKEQKERTCCIQLVTIHSISYIVQYSMHNISIYKLPILILRNIYYFKLVADIWQKRTHCTQIIAIYSMQHNLFHILLCNIFYVIYLNLCITQFFKKEHLIFKLVIDIWHKGTTTTRQRYLLYTYCCNAHIDKNEHALFTTARSAW